MAAHLKLAGADDGGSQMLDGVRVPTEVRLVAVEALLPYARNSRNHDKAQVAAIARSMKEVGFTNPLLIADGGILAGHGRLMAAKSIGLSRVPCIDLSHLSEPQRRALVIADNRLAEMASWDLEMLKLETDDLRALGLDLEAETGFAEEDLAKLFEGMVDAEPPGGGGDPDDVPDVPAVPHSRLGDVWEVAGHRVMCGSSLEAKDWDVLMAGELADVVWTDPPYNVDIGAKNEMLDRADGGSRSKSGCIRNDKMGDAAFREFLLKAFQCLFDAAKPGAPIYVAYPDMEAINFMVTLRDAGFKRQSNVIWNKNQMVLGRFDHQPRTENIAYGWKPGAAHSWYGGRKVTNVIDLGDENPFRQTEDGRWVVKVGDRALVIRGDVEIEVVAADMIHEPKPARSESHPTMKPVALVARMLRNSARAGEIVVDAFGGSGSTAVAAHQLGMRARLMELAPVYVDVIVRRLEMFTGERAVHAVTSEPFPREGEVRQPAAPVVPDAPDDGQPF